MKHLLTLFFVVACAPNGTRAIAAPRSAPDSGAFQDPSPAVIDKWVTIAEAPTIDLSQEHVILSRESFGQLLVKAIDGAPEIEQIEIEYADHESRVVKLERKLVTGEGQVIELREKRPIAKLVVFTDPDSSGTYVVFGA
jgi:hypothetical protein